MKINNNIRFWRTTFNKAQSLSFLYSLSCVNYVNRVLLLNLAWQQQASQFALPI
ncbi:hypothetical protein K661_01704 [Piscirickettsia salmonis LF-89 = ATCC VR-1361]|nr:hypothetical protein K661_01704 [Piscirickettsia salmonis LF-89 = ATCC VR-1361]